MGSAAYTVAATEVLDLLQLLGEVSLIEHWMASADLIYWNEEDLWLLGEDQHGDWWVPYVPSDMRPHWDRFSRWNLLHWARYWNSRRRNQVVFLDWDAAEDDVADPVAWSNPDIL